jgi:hypothetical protein
MRFIINLIKSNYQLIVIFNQNYCKGQVEFESSQKLLFKDS